MTTKLKLTPAQKKALRLFGEHKYGVAYPNDNSIWVYKKFVRWDLITRLKNMKLLDDYEFLLFDAKQIKVIGITEYGKKLLEKLK